MTGMEFERVWVLFLFPLAVILLYFFHGKIALGFPTIKTVPNSFTGKLLSRSRNPVLLAAIFLLSLAGAGFSLPPIKELRFGYGADFLWLFDQSDSMNAVFGQDYATLSSQGNGAEKKKIRVVEAKKVIRNFVEKRRFSGDRYGLIAFGGRFVEILPLTSNKETFLKVLDAQQAPLGATWLQPAFFYAVERLSASEAATKVLVLVADDLGFIVDDVIREEIKNIILSNKIKLYIIVVGMQGGVESFKTIKKQSVWQIAQDIGSLGRGVDAASIEELEKAFDDMDKVERSPLHYYSIASRKTPVVLYYGAFVLIFLVFIMNAFTVGVSSDMNVYGK